jgi:hypothetical protein
MKDLFGNDTMKPTPISHGKSLYTFAETMRKMYEDKVSHDAELNKQKKKLVNMRRPNMIPA